MPERPRALLAVLIYSQFVVFTNYMVLAPLLVDLAREFNISVALAGQLVTIGMVAWALPAVFVGTLSDRYGRRRTYLVGLLIMSVFTGLAAWSWDLGSLLLLRVAASTAGSAVGPMHYTIVADRFPVAQRGRTLGYLYVGYSASAALGIPLVAYASSMVGWRAVMAGLGVAVFAIFLLVWLVLWPDAPKERPAISLRASLQAALGEAAARRLLLGNVFGQTSSQVLLTYLPAFLMLSYDRTAGEVAPYLVFISLGLFAGSMGGGQLADRFDQGRLLALGLVIAGLVSVGLFGWTPGLVISTLLGLITLTARGIYMPSYISLLAGVAPGVRGTLMGMNATTNSLGTSAGAAVGGLLLALGFPALGLASLLLSLAAAGIFVNVRSTVSPQPAKPLGGD